MIRLQIFTLKGGYDESLTRLQHKFILALTPLDLFEIFFVLKFSSRAKLIGAFTIDIIFDEFFNNYISVANGICSVKI